MPIFPPLRRSLLVIAPLVACAGAGGGPPPPPGVELLPCPSANAAAAEATVDETGDVLAVRGHTFRLPRGAVTRATRFRVQDRTTGHAGVDIRPHGIVFGTPAELTISYARCRAEAAAFRDLRIVEVRPGGTGMVGAPLSSRVDTVGMTVTAQVPHLSGYLLAGTRSQ